MVIYGCPKIIYSTLKTGQFDCPDRFDPRHMSRDRNPSDRCSYRLNLTASGNALYQKILPAANKRYHEVVSCLTREELSRLRGSLEKLITHTDGLRG